MFDRVSSVHQETSLCVACHATHFPLRAQLYAARNGYPVVQRQQLQFLTERFYNNPRPFYGFEKEGAVWARVISAPANVLGRMSHLLDIFEDQISGERRAGYHEGIVEVSEPLLRGPRQAAGRRDQRQHAAGERARSRLVCVDRHARIRAWAT